MDKRKVEITTTDGVKLTALVVSPLSKNPKGVIQFHSGTVTIKEYYLKLATYLSKNGFVVVLFDYRGVGESRPTSLKGYEASISDWGQYDAEAINRWIKNEYPEIPIHLLAHSMGGQLYGLMESWDSFDKVVLLTTSSGNYNKFAPTFYRLKIKWPTKLLFPIMIRIFGYVPGYFGLGQDWPKGIAIDWQTNSKNNGLMPDYLKAKSERSYYDKINKKITAIYFTDDNMSTPATKSELPKAYPNADLNIITLRPTDVELKSIGHFGIFKKKAELRLWPMVLGMISE